MDVTIYANFANQFDYAKARSLRSSDLFVLDENNFGALPGACIVISNLHYYPGCQQFTEVVHLPSGTKQFVPLDHEVAIPHLAALKINAPACDEAAQ